MVSLIVYGGSVLTMATVSKETATSFFNNLLHGLDLGPVIREDVPLREVATGLFSAFILGWFIGVLLAAVFNFSGRGMPENQSESSPAGDARVTGAAQTDRSFNRYTGGRQ